VEAAAGRPASLQPPLQLPRLPKKQVDPTVENGEEEADAAAAWQVASNRGVAGAGVGSQGAHAISRARAISRAGGRAGAARERGSARQREAARGSARQREAARGSARQREAARGSARQRKAARGSASEREREREAVRGGARRGGSRGWRRGARGSAGGRGSGHTTFNLSLFFNKMSKAETYLIPARFALTVGHLLAVLVMFYHFVGIGHSAGAVRLIGALLTRSSCRKSARLCDF
jgi:hypothetical protein